MKKLAAEPKLLACMAAILLMLAMLCVVCYSVTSRVNMTFEIAVNSTARKLWLAGDINMAAGDMLAAQRGILLYANTPESDADLQLFQGAICAGGSRRSRIEIAFGRSGRTEDHWHRESKQCVLPGGGRAYPATPCIRFGGQKESSGCL